MLQAYYDNLGPVYNMLDKYNVRNRTEDHMNSAEVLICCEVAINVLESLQQDMLNATGGGIDVVPVNEDDLGR